MLSALLLLLLLQVFLVDPVKLDLVDDDILCRFVAGSKAPEVLLSSHCNDPMSSPPSIIMLGSSFLVLSIGA
jgi:hypothetical protein